MGYRETDTLSPSAKHLGALLEGTRIPSSITPPFSPNFQTSLFKSSSVS